MSLKSIFSQVKAISEGQLSFLKVPLSAISQEDRVLMEKFYKVNTPGHQAWQRYGNQEIGANGPTAAQQRQFMSAVMQEKLGEKINSSDIEGSACARGKPMVWADHVLKVGEEEEKHYMNTIPRNVVVESSVVQAAALVASVYQVKNGEVKATFAPSNAATGPFSCVSSELGIVKGQTFAGTVFEQAGITNSKKAKETACTLVVAAARSQETKVLLVTTYNTVLDKLKIGVESGQVVSAEGVKIQDKGVLKVLSDGEEFSIQKGGVTTFPIGKYAVKADSPNDRTTVFMRMQSNISSRVPNMLQKFYGFYGFPNKVQRKFMEIMYLHMVETGACAVNPDAGMIPWYGANFKTEFGEIPVTMIYSKTGLGQYKPYPPGKVSYYYRWVNGIPDKEERMIGDKPVVFLMRDVDMSTYFENPLVGYKVGFF